MDLNEIDAWTVSQRRAIGLRLLGCGLVLSVPTSIWLFALGGWDADGEVTRGKVMCGILAIIGVCLAVAGVHALLQVRRGIEPAVPTATAVRRR